MFTYIKSIKLKKIKSHSSTPYFVDLLLIINLSSLNVERKNTILFRNLFNFSIVTKIDKIINWHLDYKYYTQDFKYKYSENILRHLYLLII